MCGCMNLCQGTRPQFNTNSEWGVNIEYYLLEYHGNYVVKIRDSFWSKKWEKKRRKSPYNYMMRRFVVRMILVTLIHAVNSIE